MRLAQNLNGHTKIMLIVISTKMSASSHEIVAGCRDINSM